MPRKRECEPGVKLSPDAKRMMDALRYANFQSVGTALGVSRSAVQKWAAGRQVTPWNLSQVEQLLGHAKEAARPEWAERLIEDVAALREAVADKDPPGKEGEPASG
jgi:hypothetical protein